MSVFLLLINSNAMVERSNLYKLKIEGYADMNNRLTVLRYGHDLYTEQMHEFSLLYHLLLNMLKSFLNI